jgi:hypothetical protein
VKHSLKPKRTIQLQVSTTENWHPSFEDDTLRATFWPHSGHACVWGDDDFGMETSEPITREQFDWLVSEPVTMARCKTLNMILA